MEKIIIVVFLVIITGLIMWIGKLRKCIMRTLTKFSVKIPTKGQKIKVWRRDPGSFFKIISISCHHCRNTTLEYNHPFGHSDKSGKPHVVLCRNKKQHNGGEDREFLIHNSDYWELA